MKSSACARRSICANNTKLRNAISMALANMWDQEVVFERNAKTIYMYPSAHLIPVVYCREAHACFLLRCWSHISTTTNTNCVISVQITAQLTYTNETVTNAHRNNDQYTLCSYCADCSLFNQYKWDSHNAFHIHTRTHTHTKHQYSCTGMVYGVKCYGVYGVWWYVGMVCAVWVYGGKVVWW